MNTEQAKVEAERRWGVHGYAETKQVRGVTVFIVGDSRGGIFASAGSSVSWEAAFETADKLKSRPTAKSSGRHEPLRCIVRRRS